MRERAGTILRKIISTFFISGGILILGALIFGDKRPEYPEWAKNSSLLPNIVCILIGGGVVFGVFGVWEKWLSRIGFIQKAATSGFYIVLWGMSALLLGVQFFISYYLFFIAGWDVAIVTGAADLVWTGEGVGNFYYFSQYQNNVCIVYLLAIISQIAVWLGMEAERYLFLVRVSCILINLAGVTASLSVKRLTGSTKAGLVSFVLFTGLIGINPWMVIPYTDTYSILFPVLTFYLYLCAQKANKLWRECVLWILLGVNGMLGYMIKPSAVIVLIAIAGYELVLICTKKRYVGKALIHFGMIMLAIGISFIMRLYMVDYINVSLNEDLKFSYTHYLMMGLNAENTGAYCGADYGFSSQQENFQIRQEENLRVVKERLNEYGVSGTVAFMLKKLLLNYNDGTFAWEQEGGFELSPSKIPMTLTKARVERLFRCGTDWFFYYATFAQLIWIFVLCMAQAIGIPQNEEQMQINAECIMRISLIGNFLFVMLFEARARYLYNMTPVYIMCAAVGIWKMYRYMVRHRDVSSVTRV